MTRHEPMLRRVWRLAVVTVVVTAILLNVSPVGAQDGSEDPHLSLGPWSGVGRASGVAQASESGMDIVWNGSVTADLDLGVLDSGNVEGRWSHTGSAKMTLNGDVQGHTMEASGDTNFTGSGTIAGDNQVLVLDSSSHSTGNINVTSPQGSTSFPIDAQDSIPSLKVRIQYAECDEAYGDFVWAVKQGFQGVGLSSNLQGSLMLVRDKSQIQGQLSQLEGMFTGGPTPGRVNSPLFVYISDYLVDVNNLIGAWPDWQMNQVMDNLARAENFLNTLRNLRTCEKRFFGDKHVEYFAQALTFQIQQLIIGGSGLDSLRGAQAFKLMEVGTRVGAFGPGAPNPEQAVKAEEALRKACQRILEENVQSADGLIKVNEDTQKAMLTGAIMNWTFDVGGQEYNARNTYKATGFDWQKDGAEVEAGK